MWSQSGLSLREIAPARLAVEAPDGARAQEAAPVSVEITTPARFATMRREWADLCSRALVPNAFMDPAVVAAAAPAARIHVLLAWSLRRQGVPERLVGAWALAEQRPSSHLPIRVLKAPVQEHAGLGTPVLDAMAARPALDAMLEALALDRDLPRLVEIASLDAGGPIAVLLSDILAARALSLAAFDKRLRPRLRADEPGWGLAPLSSSRNKALRQRRQRLEKLGAVTLTEHDGDGIDRALAEFLRLEAAGWKGKGSRRGRAILSDPVLAGFFRAAVAGLAARDLAAITALRCDGRPVAMQVTIRAGSGAFTWKSTYDESLRACAPGLLLLQEITRSLTADTGLAEVDSCNHRDDGYMAEFWAGRRPLVDVLLDTRGDSAAFRLASRAERARRAALQLARHLRAAMRRALATVPRRSVKPDGRGAG